MNATSHNTKSSIAAISIFASGGMAAAKFVDGIAIGSLALISETVTVLNTHGKQAARPPCDRGLAKDPVPDRDPVTHA
jgi:hypothetical protein